MSYFIPREEESKYNDLEAARSSELSSWNDRLGICVGCAKILDRKPFKHHNIIHLQRSAENGCSVCSVLADTIVRNDTSWYFRLPLYRAPIGSVEFAPNGAGLFYKLGNKEWIFDLFDRKPTGSVLPKDWLGLAKHWLKKCQNHHNVCTQPMERPLPTRLLDLSDDKVRLVNGSQLPLGGSEYCALSYCWGRDNKYVTTRQNIETHQDQIAEPELPQTIRDAIVITRKLGYNYLWVDALCIIQGDAEDWARECTQMAAYYRQSVLTISALESSAATDGFLGHRQPRREAPFGMSADQYIRERPPNWKTLLRKAALSQRGWALQERLLSTRVLHFTKSEVLWECLTCSAREAFPEEHTAALSSGNAVDPESEDFKRSVWRYGKDPFSKDDGLFSLWYRIVRIYTQRSLTIKTDRLPGIEGVANFVQNTLGKKYGEYAQGIWINDPHSLLWRANSPQVGVNQPDARIPGSFSPSWSWASVDRPVEIGVYNEKRLWSGEDANIVNVTDSGSLLLVASSKEVKYLSYSSAKSKGLTTEEEYKLFIGTYGWANPYNSMVFDEEYNLCGIFCFDAVDIDELRHHENSGVEKAYCILRIGERLDESENSNGRPTVYFLVIARVLGDSGPPTESRRLDENQSTETEGHMKKHQTKWIRVGMGIAKNWTVNGSWARINIFEGAERKEFCLV